MDPPQHQDDDDDDDNINPLRIFLPDDHDHDQLKSNGSTMLQHAAPNQNHYIPSINSTILIRQLPSQGLSFQLWPAATTLVTLLDLHRSNPTSSPLSPVINALSSATATPLRVLELGSGTGLVGIAAAMTLGANVTLTDLPHVIPNLQFNADANAEAVVVGGGRVDVAALRWGKEGDGDVEMLGKDFDLIMASDVVYHDNLYEPLLYTLRLVMDDDDGEDKKRKMMKKVFVMAHLRRWKKESNFFKKAKKCFDVEVVHVDIPCEGSRIGVVVYLFSHKPPRI